MDGTLSTSTTKLDVDKKPKIFTKYFIAASAAAIVLFIISLALVIALASRGKAGKLSDIAAQTSGRGGESDVCITEACANAASKILTGLDRSVDPCDDFYQHSCGGWIDKTVIPEYRSSYSKFSELDDEMAVQLRDLLEADHDPWDPKPMLEAKDMYQACVNKDKIEELGVTPLRELHTQLGGWPLTDPTWNETEFDLLYTLSELRLLSNEYLVYLWVSADDRDSTTNIAQLDQFHFGLGHRKYYLEAEFSKEKNAYTTFIRDIAVYLGADEATVDKDVNDVMEFETYMANISMTADERRDLHALYHRYKVSELYTNISDKFDWKTYMNLLFVDTEYNFVDDTEVVVYAPDFLRKMAERVAVTPPRVLANYLVWRITEYRIANLPQALIDIENKFYRVAYSIPEEPPRWLSCVNYVNGNLGYAVGRLFVDKYFKEDSKIAMADMTKEVRKAFDGHLSQVDWMDSATKTLAREKLAVMNNHIGYPDWLHNDTALRLRYEGLEFEDDTYFQNHLNMLKWTEQESLKKITEPVKQDRWFAAPAVIDALYHDELNTIVLPAGALQPPFYHKEQPMSLNYGGIGSFIGHAITHGFDDIGRFFDKDGNVGQWWDDKTLASFTAKTECMIDQYSSYKVEEIDKYVDGENTLAENIADNGAVKTSYEAFLKHEEANGPGQRLPGLMQYNSKQLFFLNLAQVDCRIDRLSSLTDQVIAGYHTPGKWRVIGSISNSPEFAKVFSCPANSVMNPVDKCNVW